LEEETTWSEKENGEVVDVDDARIVIRLASSRFLIADLAAIVVCARP
jgi:hypothetical protein